MTSYDRGVPSWIYIGVADLDASAAFYSEPSRAPSTPPRVGWRPSPIPPVQPQPDRAGPPPPVTFHVTAGDGRLGGDTDMEKRP